MSYYYRPATERGTADFGWLQSHHSFSFGRYYDPDHMGFSVLRVINDDTVAGGAGFGAHGHANMEIISYVTAGKMRHADSLGNRFVVPAGDIQRMSAGSGIEHSEYNDSDTESLKFLQIWLEPNQQNVTPSYQQATVPDDNKPWTVLVTPQGHDNTLSIHQNVSLSRVVLAAGEATDIVIQPNRWDYLHVITGQLQLETFMLTTGDALGIRSPATYDLHNTGSTAVEALWFDLPPE